MKWLDNELINPASGKPLRRDSPHSFSDGAQRFPVIEEIPYLRVGRDELTAEVLCHLDNGDTKTALILLFQDQDDWARTAAPDAEDLQPLFDETEITLRAAMSCLKYGAVADYFAYRWSDPTFLSGLKLLETHLSPKAGNICELACGIGHYLRELTERGGQANGADVVFSKLWLARRYVAPKAKLVCCDANYAFPFADKVFDAWFCHDAFYFLPEKTHVANELKRTTRGAILIGHAHNADAANFSAGAAISVAAYAELFAEKVLYDDAELTAAYLENRQPVARSANELRETEAISFAESDLQKEKRDFSPVKSTGNWRVNPLLLDENGKVLIAPQFPSERYLDEYAALSDYLNLSVEEAQKLNEISVDDLSEKDFKTFARRRILLDLPEDW